jgi:hypothetical protein
MAKKNNNKTRQPSPKDEYIMGRDEEENSINATSNLLIDVFDVLFGYNFDMAIKPIKMLMFILIRGLIIYIFCSDFYNSPLNEFLNYLGKFWFGGIFGVPICLYSLFYVFSWIITLLALFYGSKTIPNNQGEYSEINKFKNWRDNKMKYTDYEGATDLMRKSSVLNNLDENDPQARKTLDYINNKLKFMSYQDGLKWLSGRKD